MSETNNLVYICVHCGQVVENKDSEWHDRQCPAKHVNLEEDQEDIELNVDEVEEETPEAKQVEKGDYVTQLINAVRDRVLLWDKYQKRDNPGRQKMWAEIEQQLGISSPGVAKKDWAQLREKYRNERAILNRAAQAGRPIAPRWDYYSNMSFLDQNELPRPTTGVNSAPKVVSSKIVTLNGKKITPATRSKGKPGPKPGTKRKKAIITKPVTRSKREPKPTHSQATAKIVTPSTTAKMNELRVVVSRNDFRDLSKRKNMNSHMIMKESSSRKRPQQADMESSAMKQVCIRHTEHTQMNSEHDHDTVGKFCSYLEVMLRTLPKEKQEVFYEETLDHLATLKRQIRRSNHSNPNYM